MYKQFLNFDVYNVNKEYIGKICDYIFISGSIVFIIINIHTEIFIPYVKYKYIININFLKNYLIINSYF